METKEKGWEGSRIRMGRGKEEDRKERRRRMGRNMEKQNRGREIKTRKRIGRE